MAIIAHSVVAWHDMDETPEIPEGREAINIFVCKQSPDGRHFVSVARYDAEHGIHRQCYEGKRLRHRKLFGIYSWARYPFGDEIPMPSKPVIESGEKQSAVVCPQVKAESVA